MARSYKRDKNGRFAGGGGGGGGGRSGGSKPIQRGTNRLTRDNAGRITSQGGDGATARGGRLATASGNKRATQTAKLSGGGSKGTVGKPKGLKPGAIKPKAAAPAAKKPMTKAEYEAAAKKAWGPGWNAKGSKPKQTADQQLDRLASRSRNMQNARTGLTKAEAAKASELSKQTGRRVRVTQNENGSFAVTAAPARRRGTVGKIDDAKAGRIVARIDANRPGRSLANGSARKTANSIRTHERAVEFALASSRRAMRKGSSSLTVNESLQKAVANASKKKRK